ncbi:MAG: glycosyltransferase family protein [Magnetococcales bacterium]|nr:glycosyltransferase family protein [Magnetococcales bacterium]
MTHDTDHPATEQPDTGSFVINAGDRIWHQVLALNAAGRFAEAMTLMDPMFAPGVDPGLTAWKLRGQSMHGLGRLAEAARIFALVLQRTPNDGDSHAHLATALLGLNRLDQALLTVNRGLQQTPGNKELLRLQMVLLWRMGRKDEALALANHRVRDFSQEGPMWHERGIFLLEQGADKEALADFEMACSLMPNDARVHNNRATALWRLGQYRASLAAVERAVALDPNHASAQHHRALLLLFLGDYASGFPAYEWRWRDPAHLARQPSLTSSPWRGELMRDATLLIYPEQGFGDTIQFIRFLPKVAQRVGKIIFSCSGPLAPLLRQAPGIDLLWDGEPPSPVFQVHAPLMSLPALLQQTRDQIPGVSGYLPEFSWVKPSRNRSSPLPLRIGLVWRGRATHRNDHNRSLDLAWFDPLLDLDFLTWVSLQEGAEKVLMEHPHWRDRMACPNLADFAVTARIIQTLDLVIAVDTAVAHLAGALGCPVWVLLPFVPDWRWGPEGESTVWYRSMRLFRQPAPGDWEPVRKRLVQALNHFHIHDD